MGQHAGSRFEQYGYSTERTHSMMLSTAISIEVVKAVDIAANKSLFGVLKNICPAKKRFVISLTMYQQEIPVDPIKRVYLTGHYSAQHD